MKRDRDDKKKTRFVRYKEGAALYSMCQTEFERLAKDANAIYKVDKLVLVKTDILIMSHSTEFWNMIAAEMPDYKKAIKWLNTKGNQMIERLNI